jgi:hypothetical protein
MYYWAQHQRVQEGHRRLDMHDSAEITGAGAVWKS